MKGGGDWEEYCPACGLPFGEGYGMEHGYDWMTQAYGFETGDDTKHRVFELFGYDYGGRMIIENIRDRPFNTYNSNENNNGNSNKNSITSNEINSGDAMFHILYGGGYNDAEKREGIAIHRDCTKAIESKLGRKLTWEDAILLKRKVRHKDLMGFDDQWFDWKGAAGIESNYNNYNSNNSNNNNSNNNNSNSNNESQLPGWMFASPLRNKQAMNRIIAKLPEEMKEKSVTRSRAIHTMLEHVNALPKNMAGLITPYVTGIKPYEYMPEKFAVPTLHPEAMKRKRTRRGQKLRKTRKARKSMRR